MDSAVESLSGELDLELAINSKRPVIDPRTVPVRFSWIKNFSLSAAHAFQAVQDLDLFPSTLATRIGSGTHAMTFGQPVYRYVPRRSGKAWDLFKADKGSAPILSAKEWEQSELISAAIKSNDLASQLLFGPGVIVEQPLDWTIDGRACRGTPDARGPYTLTDLKTCKTSQPERFVRDATWRAYHAQLAWYRRGIELATGKRPEECYIVAVESRAPYAVTVLRLTERALDYGDRLWRIWWEQLRVCEESGVWPAYSESITDFDVPDETELVFGDDALESEIL